MFAELVNIDIEEALLLYQAYGVSKQDYTPIFNNAAEYKVPVVDMFLYLFDMMDEGIVNLTGDNADKVTGASRNSRKGSAAAARGKLEQTCYNGERSDRRGRKCGACRKDTRNSRQLLRRTGHSRDRRYNKRTRPERNLQRRQHPRQRALHYLRVCNTAFHVQFCDRRTPACVCNSGKHLDKTSRSRSLRIPKSVSSRTLSCLQFRWARLSTTLS